MRVLTFHVPDLLVWEGLCLKFSALMTKGPVRNCGRGHLHLITFNSNGAARIADVLFDGTMRRGRSDSRQRHHPVGFAAGYDGLGGSPFARTIGNASHLAPGLYGKVGDRLQGQASSVVF
jgi:hypothetical protein